MRSWNVWTVSILQITYKILCTLLLYFTQQGAFLVWLTWGKHCYLWGHCTILYWEFSIIDSIFFKRHSKWKKSIIFLSFLCNLFREHNYILIYTVHCHKSSVIFPKDVAFVTKKENKTPHVRQFHTFFWSISFEKENLPTCNSPFLSHLVKSNNSSDSSKDALSFDSEELSPVQVLTCFFSWYLVGFSHSLIIYEIKLQAKHCDLVTGWVNPLWSWAQLLPCEFTLLHRTARPGFALSWRPVVLAIVPSASGKMTSQNSTLAASQSYGPFWNAGNGYQGV